MVVELMVICLYILYTQETKIPWLNYASVCALMTRSSVI